jgi:hypothetical protein
MSPVASDFLFLESSERKTVVLADDHVVPVLGRARSRSRVSRGQVLISHVLFSPRVESAVSCPVATIYDHGGHVTWGAERVGLYGAGHRQALVECSRVGSGWYLEAPVTTGTHAMPEPSHCLLCGSAECGNRVRA